MKVLIACVGSRGDAEPYVAVADRLLQEGHSVSFVVQPELKHLAPLAPASRDEGDVANIEIHEWPFTQFDFYKYANNPTKGADLQGRLRFTAIVADVLGELVLPQWRMVLEAATGCQLVITSTLARPLCFMIAEKCKIPCILINLQPLVPTRLFPHYSQDNFVETLLKLDNPDIVDADTGSDANKDSYLTLERHQFDFLQERLDVVYEEMQLEPKMDFDTLSNIISGNVPSVIVGNAFFDSIVPRIADGGPTVQHISSLADHYIPNDFVAPQDVVDFLTNSADKPICVGFGSMPYSKVSVILNALKSVGHRAILIGKALELSKPEDGTDESGLSTWVLGNVLQATSLPYAWLLPQCRMMLCHGGAGVTHATLRAGIPPVISPLIGDQFAFADLLEARGLGARAGKSLGEATEEDFTAAMKKAMGCIEAAKAFGENIRSQPLGVDNLMTLIHEVVSLAK